MINRKPRLSDPLIKLARSVLLFLRQVDAFVIMKLDTVGIIDEFFSSQLIRLIQNKITKLLPEEV